ncbi:twin-arginine translocase subunit TatC [Kribbia dieselivorans]|uniref:twin-arginine translocase subunit TatC n=1 Tax=Kribbia dieselivorans TaxID=331526 RepID=UPI000AB8E2C8|nr:twin-arginine translocase subunit TatC [Kribbia dieselivorans]
MLKKRDNPDGRMSLQDHLLEFRKRLMIAALAIVLGSVAGWFLFDPVYEQLTSPIKLLQEERGAGAIINLNYAGMTAAFSQRLSIAIFVGFIVSSPVWLYQLWAFIVPGLTRKEKWMSLAFIAAIVPLFLAGCWFGFITLPKAITILLGFTPDGAANLSEASAYFKFVTRFIVVFGLAWLLPVFLVALNVAHVLSGKMMLSGWRPAVLLIFIAAAIITPTPDPFTMFLLAGPLIVLYFAAVIIALINDKRRSRQEPEWLHTSDDEASAL